MSKKQKHNNNLFYGTLLAVIAIFAFVYIQEKNQGLYQQTEFIGAATLSSITPSCGFSYPSPRSLQRYNFTAIINYIDPQDQDYLRTCKYRVISNGTVTKGWTSAGWCYGSDFKRLYANISVGWGGDCRHRGNNTCRIDCYVQDSVGPQYSYNSTVFSVSF